MKKIPFFIMSFLFVLLFTFPSLTIHASVSVPQIGVTYSSHVQNIGWQGYVSDGQLSGTTDQSLRLEAIKMSLTNNPGAHIKYQVHVQNIGWQNWAMDDSVAGAVGQNLRVEAIRIFIDGAPGYHVNYQVHVQNIGWQNWVKDGAVAGTVGQSLRVEAIRISITHDSINPSNYYGYVPGALKFATSSYNLKYTYAKVGNIDWTAAIQNGVQGWNQSPAHVYMNQGTNDYTADIIIGSVDDGPNGADGTTFPPSLANIAFGGDTTKAYLSLNDYYQSGWTGHQSQLVAHELGHTFTLNDINSPYYPLMRSSGYNTWNENNNDYWEPTIWDVLSVNQVY